MTMTNMDALRKETRTKILFLIVLLYGLLGMQTAHAATAGVSLGLYGAGVQETDVTFQVLVTPYAHSVTVASMETYLGTSPDDTTIHYFWSGVNNNTIHAWYGYLDTIYDLEPNTTYYLRTVTVIDGVRYESGPISFTTLKSSQEPSQPESTSATGVRLPSTDNAYVKCPMWMHSVLLPEGSEGTIVWKSSNTKVLTIDQEGRMTGKRKGKATIYATVGGNTSKCVVTVHEASISFAKSSIKMLSPQKSTLGVKVTPNHFPATGISWHSNNPDVVEIVNGVAQAIAEGTATITASLKNGKKATCKVEVVGELIGASFDNVNTDPNNKTTVTTFRYADSFFAKDARNVDGHLAIASSIVAATAYQETFVRDVLQKMRFGNIDLVDYERKATRDNNDFVAFATANKKIRVNGKEQTLFVLFVRGTPGNLEWLSNFNMGKGGDHLGFHTAAEKVYGKLLETISANRSSSDDMIWITGHSRGAAVANIIAARLGKEKRFAQKKIFTYTYATPNVSQNATKDSNIHNFVNHADFVTRVPLQSKWGYKRNGHTVPEKGLDQEKKAVQDKMKAHFKLLNGNNYLGLSRDQTNRVIAKFGKYAPSVYAYNNDIEREAYDPSTQIIRRFTNKPYEFFGGLARFLGGESSDGVSFILRQAAVNADVESIVDEILVTTVAGTVLNALRNDGGINVKPYPIMHAHSKEAYIAYMKAIYE